MAMSNKIILREFAYFDRQKVEDFLSSIENGLTRERTEIKSKINAEAKGKLDIGVVEVEGGLGRKGTRLQELKASTDASLFQRLYTHLEKQKLIQVLSRIGDENFRSIETGDILEFVGEIKLPKMEILMDLFTVYLPLIGLDKIDENNRQILLFLSKLMQQYGVNIKIMLQDKSYNVIATLIKENLRVPKRNLNGEYKVLCRVQKKMKEGESFDLFSFMPGIKLPEEIVQNMIKTFNENPNLTTIIGEPFEIEDFRIGYPAIVVTPIAIYR